MGHNEMGPIEQLPRRWRRRAADLRPYAPPAAQAFEAAADDLADALQAAADELLTPSDAADYAGVTERTLRTWRADGRITNHGTDGRPLYRRGELPRTPSTSDTPDIGYDPAADARSLAG
ncbi:MAG: helix-turn-helix domain-containing protein [Longimicrobiales bacterium]